MESNSFASQTGLSADDLELLSYFLEEEGVDMTTRQMITPRAPDAPMPLSFAQERLWFLDQWDPGNPAYDVPFATHLRGVLHIPAFEQSLNEILRRHEALRTIFPAVDGRPSQQILPPSPLAVPILDISHLPADQRRGKAEELAIEHAQLHFDLATGPLVDAALVRLDDHEHVFLLNIHHIIFDAWSVGQFMRELTILYDAFSKGKSSPLPELPIQYADFAIWQRAWLRDEVLAQQLAYWHTQLHGPLPILELPTDYPRPAVLTHNGKLSHYQLPASLNAPLARLNQEENTTLFMTLFAAFQTLMYRYTGQEDIITGSLIANRDFVDIEALMGFFVNTLLLRTDLAGNPTFRELLGRVRETMLESYAHQNVPFEQLVEELRPQRDPSHTPLFQVMFILQNAPIPARAQHDLEVTFLRIDNKTSKFDLTLSVTEAPDGMRAVAEYNTDLFEQVTIDRMLGHYRMMLESIIANPDCRINDLELLTPEEYQQLNVWHEPVNHQPTHHCIHELFEEQVRCTPMALAVEHEGQQLTYAELNQRANQVAHALRAHGIGRDALVGIHAQRSLEMIIGLLGVLKAGGAYVPLDPNYPRERLAFMLADARPPVVITTGNSEHEETLRALVGADSVVLDLTQDWSTISQHSKDNLDEDDDPEQLAYVIYTSGSVGQPKGVLIPHQSLVNYVESSRTVYQITALDRVLQFASISFDASAEEIYTTLTSGATLVLRTDQMLETPATFLQLCDHWKISVLSLPTAYWHGLIAAIAGDNLPLPAALRLLIIGGERALPDRVALWQQHCPAVPLINTYGPTEATIVATTYAVPATSNGERLQELPIGRPLQHITAHVLDERLRPVPLGIPGELCLGGACLARGYLNQPTLTDEKFVLREQPGQPPERLYRTGDLVRYLSDGNLEFRGRIDHQVKIRGFRIELGEVETVLRQHTGVREAAVVAREDTPGDKRLVGYLVPAEGTAPTVRALRAFMGEHLPDYMIPSAFVVLEQLPLSGSGKINLRALPAPDDVNIAKRHNVVAPRTPLEHDITRIWQEVLKLPTIGVYDNFFELGGHSLLATQIIARLRATFQVDLPLRHLFASPTIAGIAEMIEAMRWVTQETVQDSANDDALEEGEL